MCRHFSQRQKLELQSQTVLAAAGFSFCLCFMLALHLCCCSLLKPPPSHSHTVRHKAHKNREGEQVNGAGGSSFDPYMNDLWDNVGYGFDFVDRQHAILVLAVLPNGS